MNTKRIIIVLLIGLQLFHSAAWAATCTFVGSSCTDSTTPSKVFGGQTVPISVVGGCWHYQDTYSCETPGIDYCQPLINLHCGVLNTNCDQTSTLSGACLLSTSQYLCTDVSAGEPPPANVALMDTSYRITSEQIDESNCATLAARTDAGTCMVMGNDVCSDANSTRNINGLDVTRDCWAWTRTYSCMDGGMASTCTPLINDPDCTETESSCVDQAADGSCTLYQRTFRCQTGGTGTDTVTSCDTQQYCDGAICFDMGYQANTAFAEAISTKELLRQMGAQIQDDLIFNGKPMTCHDKDRGTGIWGNCCDPEDGGNKMSNNSVAREVLMSVGKGVVQYGAQAIWQYGSTYLYNTLITGGGLQWLESILFGAVTTAAAPSMSFSFYGLTVTYSATAGFQFSFDVVSFLIAVIIWIVQDYTACDRDDQITQLALGQNLCVHVDNDCIQRDEWRRCVNIEEHYCCYASVLGKLIAVQGGAQIGRPPRKNACQGFTPEELQRMDFSRMNFSEFIQTITIPSPNIGPTGATTNAVNTVNSAASPE